MIGTERVRPSRLTNPTQGRIRLDLPKTLWLGLHAIGGLAALTFFPSMQGLLVFLALTAITICAGHSVGMHRLLIHRSFKAKLWVEYLLVCLGVLVGMAGPFGMMRAHDLRDWHQRQPRCPDHPAHRAGFWRDGYWQLCCRFDLDHPPEFVIEPQVKNDPVYRFMERFWMAQQVPLALGLYALGGWGFVLWGVCLRVSVSLTGHWMVGHFAHKRGQQDWRIEGLEVQGFNLPGLGLVTFGENWHGNHHAFPHSAKLGIAPGQLDPGYGLVRALAFLRLVWDIQGPRDAPARAGLTPVSPPASRVPTHRESASDPLC